MMESIAGMATSMSAAQVANQYAISVAKKSMEAEELAAQELLNMLPDVSMSKGQYIDVYA